MKGRVRSVLKLLASLEGGELTSLSARVEEAREQLLEGGQQDLAEKLALALDALEKGQIALFRKLVATVQARVGHLKT